MGWCGPDSGASAALPVGSVVDQVVIHKDDSPASASQADGTATPTVTTQDDTVTVTTLD